MMPAAIAAVRGSKANIAISIPRTGLNTCLNDLSACPEQAVLSAGWQAT